MTLNPSGSTDVTVDLEINRQPANIQVQADYEHWLEGHWLESHVGDGSPGHR
jgi:hypothetical protein